MSEYEGCYVFHPEITNTDGLAISKPKRQIISETVDLSVPPDEQLFVPLLTGLENVSSVKARSDLFHAAWSPRQALIDNLLQDANNNTVAEVTKFIVDLKLESQSIRKIPAGLIVAKPGAETYSKLIDAIAEHLRGQEKATVVNLTSSHITNLKSVLKYINQHATNQDVAMADEETALDRQKGGRQLNYDLQILNEYVKLHSIGRVVISFQDSEAFEGGLLGDIVEVLSSWNDRIPFVLLFGITTSIDLFQEKLSRTTVRSLQGTRFDVEELPLNGIFEAVMSLDQPRFLWLGPGLSSTIIQRHNDYVQSTSSFVEAIKYAYMAHFFANPLSILLNNCPSPNAMDLEHYESIRNLPSFQRLVETLLGVGDYEAAQALLNDNEYLFSVAVREIDKGQQALRGILLAIEVISTLQSYSLSTTSTSWSNLYIKAISGELGASTLIKDILLSFRKVSSDSMSDQLSKLTDLELPGISKANQELKKLTSTMDDEATPLRSEHNIRYNSLRTTVVAQKVSLSKQSSTLSKQDLAYSKVVNSADTTLRDFFQTKLINPRDLFLHEVLIYDSKSPHRDVFTPKPRFAVERALSLPQDYLDCTCCEGAENGLSATQPATAILYQLYLESGAIVNTSDLWSAFYAIVGVENAEDEDADRQKALALFSRALAELKYLGMVKNSRKKADHLVKVLWKGL